MPMLALRLSTNGLASRLLVVSYYQSGCWFLFIGLAWAMLRETWSSSRPQGPRCFVYIEKEIRIYYELWSLWCDRLNSSVNAGPVHTSREPSLQVTTDEVTFDQLMRIMTYTEMWPLVESGDSCADMNTDPISCLVNDWKSAHWQPELSYQGIILASAIVNFPFPGPASQSRSVRPMLRTLYSLFVSVRYSWKFSVVRWKENWRADFSSRMEHPLERNEGRSALRDNINCVDMTTGYFLTLRLHWAETSMLYRTELEFATERKKKKCYTE